MCYKGSGVETVNCSRCGSTNCILTAFGQWVHCLDCRNTVEKKHAYTEVLA